MSKVSPFPRMASSIAARSDHLDDLPPKLRPGTSLVFGMNTSRCKSQGVHRSGSSPVAPSKEAGGAAIADGQEKLLNRVNAETAGLSSSGDQKGVSLGPEDFGLRKCRRPY